MGNLTSGSNGKGLETGLPQIPGQPLPANYFFTLCKQNWKQGSPVFRGNVIEMMIKTKSRSNVAL